MPRQHIMRANMKTIETYLTRENWGTKDFRDLKTELFYSIQEKQKEFHPLMATTYKDNPIQIIDFFSGAGGASLGFASVNSVIPAFKMLGGCDINAISAQTYSRNYDTPLINEDIRSLAHDPQKLHELLIRIGYDPQKPTILIGCAPCQGFSSHRKKHWNEEDVRNSLVIAFAEIVEQIKPDAIIMENVPEFLSKRYWHYFSAAKNRFEKNGYTVKQNIYNAAMFGVPQERFRSIVIAMKKEFLMPVGILEPSEYKTVREAIGDLPPVPAGVADPTDPMHKSAAHKESTLEVIRQVPHDGGSRPAGIGPKCLDKTKGFSDVYGRLYWDRPSITITHYARNPASGRYTHPEQDRGLTAREVAILQSFPNGFEFTGKSDDIYRQIGEAVPPLLATGVAVDVLVELISSQPTTEQLLENPEPIEKPVSSSYSSVIAGIKTKGKAK